MARTESKRSYNYYYYATSLQKMLLSCLLFVGLANAAWTRQQQRIERPTTSGRGMFRRTGFRPDVSLSFELTGANTFSHTGDMMVEITLENTGTDDLFFVPYDSPFTDGLFNNIFAIKPKRDWVYTGCV